MICQKLYQYRVLIFLLVYNQNAVLKVYILQVYFTVDLNVESKIRPNQYPYSVKPVPVTNVMSLATIFFYIFQEELPLSFLRFYNFAQ
jgi:hypothetical protein